MKTLSRMIIPSIVCVLSAIDAAGQRGVVNESNLVIDKVCWYEYSPPVFYYQNFTSDPEVRRAVEYNLRNESGVHFNQSKFNGCAACRQHSAEFAYQVGVRNIGDTEIVAVDWTYVFGDSETQRVVSLHSFVTREHIPPHKARVLSEVSASPPGRLVSVRSLLKNPDHPFVEKVVINSIRFSDGSVWTRSRPQ